ncbi:hypothetical protein GCM10009847_11460 [Leucobacter tardus]
MRADSDAIPSAEVTPGAPSSTTTTDWNSTIVTTPASHHRNELGRAARPLIRVSSAAPLMVSLSHAQVGSVRCVG